MNLVLARIDDRFIHGQVTVGWGLRLRPDLILLANDELKVVWKLRRVLMALESGAALELLIDRLKSTKSNAEFLLSVAKSSQ